ncbi:hypothetical protein DPMN_127433 [Dreissena polymorpha]|uniref:Uncharacterized protein n=1 Tax=Dreissena polymorpha TaxID=45954 RepID=A0A9D4H182_DREPO|nr:hypothetical protein DPMN_127433 [Dreissena polymorpha]
MPPFSVHASNNFRYRSELLVYTAREIWLKHGQQRASNRGRDDDVGTHVPTTSIFVKLADESLAFEI